MRKQSLQIVSDSSESTSQFVSRIAREYGIYVLDSRAIPAASDGLKTSQRIALWLIRNKPGDTKTISLAGEMISSKLYVHGDAAAADTISRLAAPYLNNHCLIQGEGQFGTRVSPVDGIGAPRYTDVRRAKFAEEHLYMDLDILPMVENYDGSVLMPRTFLPRIPLVLLNGVSGIATGWSTEILPRRLDELKKAVQEYLKTGKIKSKLLPHYERYDVDVIQMDGDRNKYVITGKIEKVNTSTVRITELPPDLTLDKFKERLSEMEEEDKISEFIDRTTDRIDIEIKMKRAVLGTMEQSRLIEYFKLRTIITERIIVQDLNGGTVRGYDSPHELIADFVDWRLQWYETRYQEMKNQEEQTLLFWKSFHACFTLSPVSVAMRIMKFSGKAELREEVKVAIKEEKLPVVDEIVDRIIGLPVYRWTQEGVAECEAKIKESQKKISEYKAILKDPERRKEIYLTEVA